MRTLKIEWRHLDVAGDTCDRCYDTGVNLVQEVKYPQKQSVRQHTKYWE